MENIKIKIIISTSNLHSSDLTGSKIRKGESFILIQNKIEIKKSELDEIIYILSEKPLESENISSTKVRSLSECHNCDNDSDYLISLQDDSLSMCENCIKQTIEKLKEARDVLENSVYFEGRKGVVIHANTYSYRKIDFIDNKELKKDNTVISIITGPEKILCTKLKNIEKLIDILEEDGIFNSNENCTHVSNINKKCMSCNDSSKDLIILDNLILCSKCVDDIHFVLKEYLEDNGGEVISNII